MNLRHYFLKINPIVAILVCALCWIAAVKTELESPVAYDPISLFLFAFGAFGGLTLYSVGRIWLLVINIRNQSQTASIRAKNGPRRAIQQKPTNLDAHFTDYPDPKIPFSLFQTEWQHFLLQQSNGELNLVANRLKDKFIPFCAELINGLDGKTVLELGPFEGFHSHRLAECGAGEIISIEANPRNFLKCLIVKNYYQLDRVTYLLGDFSEYLESTERHFDFVLAAGILYHLSDPFLVLDRIMKRTNAIGICTTFFDSREQGFRFSGKTRTVNYEGTEPFVLHQRFNPKGTLGRKHGIDDSAWMFTKDDLLRFLEYRKFKYAIREAPPQVGKGPRIQLFAYRD